MSQFIEDLIADTAKAAKEKNTGSPLTAKCEKELHNMIRKFIGFYIVDVYGGDFFAFMNNRDDPKTTEAIRQFETDAPSFHSVKEYAIQHKKQFIEYL